MSEYTKGPWVASGFEVFDEKQRDPVADCCFRDYDTNRANANLIAASPLMHTALTKIAFRCLAFIGDDRPMQVESIKAILKICDDAIDSVNQ